MNGQPENDKYEQYSARRASKLPKKRRKQGSAREKDGTQMTTCTEPLPGRRGGGPPDDDDSISANCHLSADVSVPNLVRKYAFCGNFQTLQKKRAAAPEPTLQTKMKKIQI